MKKLYLKHIFMCLFLFAGINASAYDAYVGGIYYNLDTTDKTASVTYRDENYNSYSLANIFIPSEITYNSSNYKVTDIYYSAFRSCTKLKSITIPSSVTSIGGYAFEGCTNLVDIRIPNSVYRIGKEAFEDTPWFQNQADGFIYAGKVLYTYKGTMPSNTSLTLEEGTLGIASRALEGQANLKSVVFPSSIRMIYEFAFNECDNLETIVFPDNVKSTTGMIHQYAFQNCCSITSVKIPEGFTGIGVSAFTMCSFLTSVTIPSSITSIRSYSFDGCNSLNSVTAKMKTPVAISESTFSNRSQCTLYVPKGRKAAYQAANYWKEFKEIIEIPEYNDGDVFTALTEEGVDMKFMVTSATDKTCIVTGGLDEDGLVGLPAINTQYAGQITIPSEAQGFKVTNIGFGAFMDCENLTSVHVSEGIEVIEPYAFHYCRKLESVSLPESLRQIQREAFEGCTSLNSIVIPKNVCELGENDEFELGHCLQNTPSLSSIVVDEANAYYDSRDNCNAVISKATNTLVIGCKNTVIPNGITSIGEYAFEYCENLTSINIPESVNSIQKYAFNGCKSLTSITIPKEVSSLGKNWRRGKCPWIAPMQPNQISWCNGT